MKLKKPKLVEIDFETWYVYDSPFVDPSTLYYDPYLLNRDGFRCCLGFHCKAMGLDDDDVFEIGNPGDVALKLENVLPGLTSRSLLGENSDFARAAIDINDSIHLKVSKKIEQLLTLANRFKQNWCFFNVPIEYKNEINKRYYNRIKFKS